MLKTAQMMLKICLILFFSASVVFGADDSCPDKWHSFFQSNCYLLSKSSAHWQLGELYCRNYGKTDHLLEVKSRHETPWSDINVNGYWIGIKKGTKDTKKWSNSVTLKKFTFLKTSREQMFAETKVCGFIVHEKSKKLNCDHLDYYFCKMEYDHSVNGKWSEWTNTGPCSMTCDPGSTQSFARKCNNPAPSNGGLDCVGDSTKVDKCSDKLPKCPTKKLLFANCTQRTGKNKWDYPKNVCELAMDEEFHCDSDKNVSRARFCNFHSNWIGRLKKPAFITKLRIHLAKTMDARRMRIKHYRISSDKGVIKSQAIPINLVITINKLPLVPMKHIEVTSNYIGAVMLCEVEVYGFEI